MPQMHFYVSEETAKAIRTRAAAAGLSISRYLRQLVEQEPAKMEWPEGFFDRVYGGWKGEPLVRPPQGELDEPLPW